MSSTHTILYLKSYKMRIYTCTYITTSYRLVPTIVTSIISPQLIQALATYFQFAVINYMLTQQLYAISSYTHKASAIILTRVGTAFINLCPTSVPSPSWCTVTLVIIHHVLGRNTVSCGATVSFTSITTWYIFLKAFYSCKPDPLWIAFSITSVLDTTSNL